MAVVFKQYDYVAYLLEKGADVHARSHVRILIGLHFCPYSL